MDEHTQKAWSEMSEKIEARKMHFTAQYLVDKGWNRTEDEALIFLKSLSQEEKDRLYAESNEWSKAQEIQKRKAEAEAKKKRADEQKKKAQREAYDAYCSRIPLRYKDADIDHFSGIMQRACQHIQEGHSMLMLGENGIGKTYLAHANAKRFVLNGETAMVVKAGPMLSRIKFSFNNDDDCYSFAEKTYGENIKHLFIDEIDKISATDADYRYLAYVIDYRYERMLQSVATGNKKAGVSAKEMVGASTFSRLTGDGGWALELGGEDKRKNAK